MTQSIKPMAHLKAAITSFAVIAGVTFTGLNSFDLAYATETAAAATMADKVQSGTFEKSSFKINGDWQIVYENGQTIFRLSEEFKTKNGPDLKLFLSPKTVGNATGSTATTDAVRLGVLRTNKGSQDYVIPEGVDLSEFGSILIHCEAFSKLWGGANL